MKLPLPLVRVRLAWRRLRGRCVLCARVREKHGARCYHCASQPTMCHWCAKNLNFSRLYGSSRVTQELRLMRSVGEILDQKDSPASVGFALSPMLQRLKRGRKQAAEIYRDAEKIDEWPGDE
jgi:hypothetical protein